MSDLCGFQIFFGVDFDSVFYYFEVQVRAVFVFLSVVVGNRADFVARFKRLPRGESLFGVYRIIYGFKPVAWSIVTVVP